MKQTFTPQETSPPPARGRSGGGQERSEEVQALQFREISPLLRFNARRLRKSMTDAEKKLWHYMRDRRLGGFKFRRQHPVDPYIADFACVEAGLIVELDGSQHIIRAAYDKKRDIYLQQKGYRVLRFWNNDVYENLSGVMETILHALDPHLTSPLQGEE